MEPVRVYTVLGDERQAQASDFKELESLQAGMLSAYRDRDFDEAARLIEACRKCPLAPAGYYKIFEERVTQLKTRRPGDDWDGVYDAASK